MVYKGVEYPFAFEFSDVLIRNEPRKFRIVVSDYREQSRDFSGLCFENELKVTSDIRVHYGAFFEIVNKIVNGTSEAEQFYMDRHNGQIPKPMLSVTDPEIVDLFEKRKKSYKSLAYYEELRQSFEKPESILAVDFYDDKQLDIFDAQFVLYFAAIIKNKAPDFDKFTYFRT